MKRRIGFVFVALCFLVFPSLAMADAGTPLMWFEFGHLAILNLFIGIAEGLLIAAIFRTGWLRTIGILILANYCSAFVGYLFLLPQLNTIAQKILGDAPLYNAPKFLIAMGVISLILSIILEWPFCLWALKSKPHRVIKSLVASPVAQILSYAVLVWMYFQIATLTVYEDVAIDPNLTFPNAAKYWVYFVSTKEGDIYRIHPDGSARQKILGTGIKLSNIQFHSGPYLFVIPAKNGDGFDLWASKSSERGKPRKLLKEFTRNAQMAREYTHDRNLITDPNHFDIYWQDLSMTDFRDPNSSPWDIRLSDWDWPGMTIENTTTKQAYSVGLETPFLSWSARKPTILSGDYVVFELDNQICLLDISKRKIRFITLGRGPVVTMD